MGANAAPPCEVTTECKIVNMNKAAVAGLGCIFIECD